ncbi:MAG: hypothetical protein HUU21_40420 [Polyangiaceae bacterium]|nr:hypothetical protein [Polyangiaceae bacterium]
MQRADQSIQTPANPLRENQTLDINPGTYFAAKKPQQRLKGLNQKAFNDRMNKASKYQLEDPSSNRSSGSKAALETIHFEGSGWNND